MKPSVPRIIMEIAKFRRRERAMTQPIYVLDCTIGSDTATFDVLGTSKTVYHVTYSIVETSRCSCPDHVVRGNTCKHIYFILDRVLGGAQGIANWAAAKDKIAERLAHLQGDGSVFADEHSLMRYHEILAKERAEGDSDDAEPQPRCRNDECAVCLTDFDTTEPSSTQSVQDVKICLTCLNGVHVECWRKWASVKGENCVYCRSKMDRKVGGKPNGKWGLNLNDDQP